MTIDLTTKPDSADTSALQNGINTFNKENVPDLEAYDDEVKFFVFVRNDAKTVVGGIKASCFWNTLHIDLFWLSEACREKGMGKKLILATEDFAMENNCDKAFVETTSWQAKPFYEKMGYSLMATLKDRPKGHASHYLTKPLN